MLKKQWLLVSLLLFFLLRVAQSYEVILPTQTQSEEERQTLFQQGLLQLLAQLGGESEVPDVEKKIKNPADFVERYAYEGKTLSIHYSEDLIHRLISPRSRVLRVLIWMPDNEVEEVLQAQLVLFAKDKGFTLVWPLMDLEDRANDFTHAATRYRTQAVLSGFISGETAEWHLQRGKNSTRWQGEGGALLACLMQGLTETVQYFNSKPLQPETHEVRDAFLITVHNVRSAQDFLEIETYLRHLEVIKTVTVYQIEGESATFKIFPRGNWEEALRLDPHLIPLPLADLNYRWVP